MRRTFPLVAAAVVFVAAVVVVATSPASAANILGNPGFESGLSSWSCSGGSTVANPVHSGSWALSGAASASDTGQCVQTVTVRPATAYNLSAWIRGNYVYLGVTGGPSTWTPGAAAWTNLTVAFTTAAGQTTAQVFLHGWYGQGTYNADDVSLDGPGAAPSPTTPPPTTAPPTTPPPTTPPGNPGGGLARHALIGYLHASFANGSGYIRMADVPADWDIVNLSFGEPTSVTSGDIRFNRCPAAECPNVESDADFTAAIRARQAQGKKVLISIGGQNGQVQLTSPGARDTFVRSVSAIIDRYGLDGLDIDFEGHSLYLNAGDTDF